MRTESLQVQLKTALQRLAVLQRRARHLSPAAPPLQGTLDELEHAVERLEGIQQELTRYREEFGSLRDRLEGERRRYWEFLDAAKDAYLVTSADADILDANRAAADLFNISQRFLVGKNFSVFVCTDRAGVMSKARRLAEQGGYAEWNLSVRPREKAPFQVTCRVLAAHSGEPTLRWVLRRSDSSVSHDPASSMA